MKIVFNFYTNFDKMKINTYNELSIAIEKNVLKIQK